MLKLIKKWAVLIPIIMLFASAIGFLIGKAYERGCENTRIEQDRDATVELFIARKEMSSAINSLDKKFEVLDQKVGNIEKSTVRIETTLERLVLPAIVGKKVVSSEPYPWRDK